MDLEIIADQIMAEPDGGTADLRKLPLPTDGYWVGHGRLGLKYVAAGLTRDVVLRGLEWITSLPQPPRYIGWWTSEGIFYLEPSTWFVGFSEAHDLAWSRGELAFHDIRMQKDIALPLWNNVA